MNNDELKFKYKFMSATSIKEECLTAAAPITPPPMIHGRSLECLAKILLLYTCLFKLKQRRLGEQQHMLLPQHQDKYQLLQLQHQEQHMLYQSSPSHYPYGHPNKLGIVIEQSFQQEQQDLEIQQLLKSNHQQQNT